MLICFLLSSNLSTGKCILTVRRSVVPAPPTSFSAKFFLGCLSQKKETLRYSYTYITIYQPTRHNIEENVNFKGVAVHFEKTQTNKYILGIKKRFSH